MNKSAFIKAAATLGLACGLITPVSAQVSTGLQNAAFGLGTSSAPAATGFSALSTVGTTSTTVTRDSAGAQTGSSITTSGGGGGKIGTFTTSLSEGDQQRFAVGTATNIGVNASASSTSDYQVNSNATLGVGTSNLRQTIGTSGISQTATERNSQADSYAANSASTSVGSSAEKYYEKASAAAGSSQNSGYAWWNSSYSGKSFSALTSTEQASVTSSYNAAYSSASSSAKSEYASSAAAQEASNGVISGSFVSNSSKSLSTTDPNDASANNQVTVKGIGNAASVNAQGNSSFSSVITARTAQPAAGSSGTASGSAGANVSSTASADAAATKFSSVYIQSY